jgi:hypothetical protein
LGSKDVASVLCAYKSLLNKGQVYENTVCIVLKTPQILEEY